MIQEHNLAAAASWNSPGREYEKISATLADSIEHCLLRLGVKPGEKVLDIATGTGWTARRAARLGAVVMGVDIGAGLIDAAKAFAAEENLSVGFRLGDAEKLPFENESFDVVVSTCGVMFATRHEAAAAEMARVCRKGGRLGITSWPPDSNVANKFKIMKQYMPPSTARSPFEWGDRGRVKELLGSAFALRFETGISFLRLRDAESAWDLFGSSYGPTKALAESLPPERSEHLKRDVIAFYRQYKTDLGVAVPREYLLTIGSRK